MVMFARTRERKRLQLPQTFLITITFSSLLFGIGAADAGITGLPEQPERKIEGFVELSHEEAIRTFKHLAVSMKSNYEKLRTWRGECVATIWWTLQSADAVREGTSKAVITRRRHKFVTNLEADSIATSYERIDEGSTDSVVDSGKRHVYSKYKQIATPEHSMTYAPGMLAAGFVQLGARQIPLSERINISMKVGDEFTFLGDRLDPRLYFGTTHISSLWEMYEDNIKALQLRGTDLERMLKYMRISKRLEGNRVLHRVAFYDVNNGTLINENFHDSDVGSNIVRAVDWYGDKKAGLAKPRLWYEWNYREVEGIFLPSKFYSEDQGSGSKCEMIFRNDEVNTDIDESEFAWTSFGAPDGTYVIDDTKQRIYRVAGDELEFFSDFGGVQSIW